MSKSLPNTNLADAFAKPGDRAAGLRVLGKKTAEAPQKRSEPTTAPEPAKVPPAQQTDAQAPSAPPTKRTGKAKPVAGGQLVLWTPISIRARMQAVQSTTGKLYLDQVLDALESTVEDLPDLVAEATHGQRAQGRLFERENTPTKTTEPVHRVQLTIRGFLQSQLDVIDTLVTETQAPSRSALVNAALDKHLPA